MASSSNQIKKLLKKKTSCLHYFKFQNSVFRSSTQISQFRYVGKKKIPYSRVKKRKILHSKIPPHPPTFVSKQESTINAGESFFQVCVMQHIFVL